MKKQISLLLVAFTIASCAKLTTEPDVKPDEPLVMVSKIFDKTPTSSDYNKPLIEFTYTDKQLTKAVIYRYDYPQDVETDVFNYDGAGKLTGTTITHTGTRADAIVRSTFTFDGNNITGYTLYKAGDVLDTEHSFTYQNGILTKWFNPKELALTYEYNSSGNNTKQIFAYYANGTPTGSTYTSGYSDFDDKSNLVSAIPYWVYFRPYLSNFPVGFVPGSHNPLASDNGIYTYTYTYNSYGLPITVTTTRSGRGTTYAYEYVELK